MIMMRSTHPWVAELALPRLCFQSLLVEQFESRDYDDGDEGHDDDNGDEDGDENGISRCDFDNYDIIIIA